MTNPYLVIVGCPRSGTTLLRRMVDAHHRIAVTPEIGWLARQCEDERLVTPEGLVTWAFVDDLVEKGSFGRYARLPVTGPELHAWVKDRWPVAYGELVAWLFDCYGAERGKQIVGTKTVDAVLDILTLHRIWPRARFVHLIRDGRDVCLSALAWRRAEKLASRFRTWREDAVTTASLWWEWQVRCGRESGAMLGEDLYYELRYETLVADPEVECKALCAFLGVPYDDAMPRFHEGRTRRGSGLDAKHAWLPPTPRLRDWRTEMAAEDVAAFEAVAGDLLDELGLARGAAELSPGRLEYAAAMRDAFEGRPLPARWGLSIAGVVHARRP